MILYVVSDNTAKRVEIPDFIPNWSAEYHDVPGFYWGPGDHLVCVLDTLECLVSLQPIVPECDGLDASYFYSVLFDQTDKDFQCQPATGERICYRYLHPLEYIFGA
ncbi:MAG: hypothetical protein EB075_09325 [Bacteroidetes bacterium]|nr:hypothetical protein [Bacteroidota bacterium]